MRFALLILFLGLTKAFAAPSLDDWLYLNNGQVRLGVRTNAGACIGYFAESKTGRNLLNHYDHGRFVQQSYYGVEDGSLWNKQPWRWNPVQGGDWRGHPAHTLELQTTRTNLYARTMPKHWANGDDITNAVMESRITLDGALARIHFKFTYSGTITHPVHDQELPAVFMDYALTNLVCCSGEQPWTGAALSRKIPGWPNQTESITENWAAYVDGADWGLGVYVPGSTKITCYRFAGKPGPDGSGCSYFAPIRRLSITPGFVFEYDVYLAIGKADALRETFSAIRKREQTNAK